MLLLSVPGEAGLTQTHRPFERVILPLTWPFSGALFQECPILIILPDPKPLLGAFAMHPSFPTEPPVDPLVADTAFLRILIRPVVVSLRLGWPVTRPLLKQFDQV